MCASCGCGTPNDKHGDDRHLTMEEVEAAAEAAGVSVEEVVRNLDAMAKRR